MAAYETKLDVSQFSGIYQDGDGVNLNMKYATEAENCDTRGGALRPMRKGIALSGTLSEPIGTLMHLHKRHCVIDGERDVLIAASGTKLYYKLLLNTDWTEIQGISITSDKMDYVTYETVREGERDTVDILLMTNQSDGMICVYGDDFTAAPVSTPYNFGVLGRYAERIFGSDIPGKPDKIVYSAPYNPFDWLQNNEIPEDGAGEIDQPSWDGDRFIALRSFGSYLLAIKMRKIWRVYGTDPGDYVMREQYGGGALCENTICVGDGYALMLGYDGLMIYDGSTTSEFNTRAIHAILSRVNRAQLSKSCAVLKSGVYYLALPLDKATNNNAILEYDMHEKTFNLRTDVYPTSFLVVENEIYYTSSKNPYNVYKMNGGDVLPLKWVSSYQDLHAKNVTKSGFTVYLSAKTDAPFLMTVKIETEKSAREKTFEVPIGEKMKRIRFGNNGRRFRFALESRPGVDFVLQGGLQIECELDED